MKSRKTEKEFDSIEVDVNEHSNDDDDGDLVLHGSVSKPFKKPEMKYFSNGSVIGPSVEEEIYHKKTGFESSKQTIRQTFAEDSDEEVYSLQSKNRSIIAPSVANMDDVEIMKVPKQKPTLKDKRSKNKHGSGESLTAENAVEFMIKERQLLDREFAALRAENDELKDRVGKQQHLSQPERIVVEKIVEKKVIDPISIKWKQDAEELRRENEELKRRHAETQAVMRTQKQLALEAQEHKLIGVEQNANPSQQQQQQRAESPQQPVSHRVIEEKDDPEDYSSDERRAPLRRGNSDNNIPPRPAKVHGVPKLDIPKSQNESLKNRPKSAAASSASSSSSNKQNQIDYSGLPLILWKGGILWKIPYNGHGRPERRHIGIKKALKVGKHSRSVKIITNVENSRHQIGLIYYPPTITWANAEKPDDLQNARELTLYEGAHLVEGYQSPAFWRSKTKGLQLPPEELCFSIITNHRSLDLAAENLKEAIAWKTAIHTLLIIMSSNPDWAIDNLNRKEPTWYHQQLEDPPDYYQREKNKLESQPTSQPPPSSSSRDEQQQQQQQQQQREGKELDKYHKASKEGMKQQLEAMKLELFTATKNGDYEKIQLILKKKKISVNVMTEPQQDTPLMIACRLGMVDIVNLCLYYGAKNDPHPNIGQTALHCAVESRSILCVQALLNAAIPSQSDTIITNLKDSKNQQTPLHLSCSFGDVKIVKILIAHGADISSRDKLSRTSLHMCCYYGHKICLSYILDNGGDSYLEIQDVYGNTALHYSAEQGHVACVKLLVETAANPIVKNNKGYIPFDLAQMKGHLPVCQILMAYNTPVLPLPTSRNDLYMTGLNPLERHVTYPMLNTSSISSTSNDFLLPRPHTNRSSSAGGLSSFSPSNPLSPYTPMNILQQHQLNQLYVDTAMSRSNSQNNNYNQYSGSLTSRERSPHLFQGLQLNNPLTARRMIDDEYQNMTLSSGYHQPMSTTSTSTLTSTQGFQQPFSPVVADFFSFAQPTYNSNMTNTTPITSQSIQHSRNSPEKESSSHDTACQPLEKFQYGNTSWEVYKTDEGYIYYLDMQSQHSQWDDPRVNGVIYYDETTGEYLQKEQQEQEQQQLESNARIENQQTDIFVEELDNEEATTSNFNKPRKSSSTTSSKDKGKKKSKQPQKISLAISDDSDDDQPKTNASASTNASTRTFRAPYSLETDRRGGGGGGVGGGNDNGDNNYDCDDDNDNDGDDNDDDNDSTDGKYGRMYVRTGKYSKRSTRSRDNSESLGSTNLAEDLNFSPVRLRKKNIQPSSEFEFNSQRSDSMKYLEPDNNSTMVDDQENQVRTNCFSPDKASLQRAATLQRTLSGITTSTSPNNKNNGDRSKSNKYSTSTQKLSTIIYNNDNQRNNYNEINEDEDTEHLNLSATLYSDAEESNDGNDNGDEGNGSDWDADINETKSSQPVKIGPLGNIEQTIQAQSNSTSSPSTRKSTDATNSSSNSKSKPTTTSKSSSLSISVPEKTSKIKESKLKKDKIFAPEDGGYGNGGNIPIAPPPAAPVESPFSPNESSFMNTLKAGGVSPRPSQDLSLSNQDMKIQIEPYLKMLKDGNSLLVVKNAMSKAGESRELVKLLIETADELHIVLPTGSSSTNVNQDEGKKENRALSVEELNLLKQDPIIGKYVKMHSMGVPAGNIEQKMKLENIDLTNIKRFLIAIGQQQPEQGENSDDLNSRGGGGGGGDQRNQKSRKASVPLLKIHWSPLPADKLSNSIFATARDDDSMHEEEFEEFEKLFSAQSKATVENGEEMKKKEENPKMKLYVLDSKRAQNIVIGLTQFKSIATHSNLLRSICSLHDLNGQLTSDRLQNISQLLPTPSEMKKLPDAKNSHHPAEVFCNLASKYYPDLPKRLSCFIICTTFHESHLILTSKMKRVIDACNEIISSDNLARVLQKMLTVGNIMNEGTYRGQAAGFSLDSLLKMVHTKGIDKKTSILDYVVKSLIDRGEQSTLRVADDLSFDDDTCRISGRDTTREIDQLQQSITQVEEIYQQALNNSSESELIQECTGPFCERLHLFLNNSKEKLIEINKMKELMNRKIVTVTEYFGEDDKTCETTKIFSVIKEFKTAFEMSRVTLMGRMERSKSRQLKSIQQN